MLRTLYLRRYLLNGQELLDWAAANGGGGDPARVAGMHITITYSRRPLDWALITPDPEGVTVEGGRRRVECFAHNTAVLLIEAPLLVGRHKELLRLGASGDFKYQPHVSFAYGPEFKSPFGNAFASALHFGPEVMSEVPKRGL